MMSLKLRLTYCTVIYQTKYDFIWDWKVPVGEWKHEYLVSTSTRSVLYSMHSDRFRNKSETNS